MRSVGGVVQGQAHLECLQLQAASAKRPQQQSPEPIPRIAGSGLKAVAKQRAHTSEAPPAI